jgi:LPXTG-motif cell wall-anchored protein
MRRLTTTLAAACAALTMMAGVTSAQTVPPSRLTYVTFSGPVSIPGKTLPAGTYAFRIADSNANRNIVQIFNRDQTQIFATLLAVPASRMKPTGDPIITFKETPSDRPPAVHYWYYAGDLAGNELVYPKEQAQMIANASGESVMAVDSAGTSIDEWKNGKMSRVKPDNTAPTSAEQSPTPPSSTPTTATTTSDNSAAPAQSAATPSTTTSDQSPQTATTTADQNPQPTTAPAAPAQPQPSTVMDQSAQPSTAPSTAPTTSDNSRTVGTSGRRLPKTGSELPMVALIGLLALGGAIAFRVARTA